MLDDNNRLRVSIPCVQCGYALLKLSSQDNCPECGRPIADSLDSRLLHCAPYNWLRRMQLGLMLMIASTLVYLPLQAFYAQFIFVYWEERREHFSLALLYFWLTPCLIANLLIMAGAWFLTAGDTHENTFIDRNLRRITRTTILLTVAASLFSMGDVTSFLVSFITKDEIVSDGLLALPFYSGMPIELLQTLWMPICHTVPYLFVTTTMLLLIFSLRRCKRIPSARIRYLTWFWLISLGVALACHLVINPPFVALGLHLSLRYVVYVYAKLLGPILAMSSLAIVWLIVLRRSLRIAKEVANKSGDLAPVRNE